MQHDRIITRELHRQCRIKRCEGFHLGRGNPGTARELSPNTTRRTGPSATAYTCFIESSAYSFRFFDLMRIFYLFGPISESVTAIFFQYQTNIILIRCHGAPKSARPLGHGLAGLLGNPALCRE